MRGNTIKQMLRALLSLMRCVFVSLLREVDPHWVINPKRIGPGDGRIYI
jgi:hypothetical protein